MTAEPAYAEAIEREKERLQEDMNQRLHMEPPWQLKLTAVLVLWFGINEAWEMVSGLAEGKVQIKPGCLYTLGAFGLLRRSRRSVMFVKLMMALICISVGVFAGTVLWSGFTEGWDAVRLKMSALDGLPPSGITGKLAILLQVGAIVWIAVSLSLRSVRDFLALPPLPQNLSHTRAWMGVMTVVLSAVMVEQDWMQKVARYEGEGTFKANVSVSVVDEASGRTVKDYFVRKGRPSWLPLDNSATKQSANVVYQSGPARSFRVTENVVHSLDLTIFSADYEPQDITIDKTTPPELVVKLKPVKP